jgi:hypothetical protein
MGGWMGGGGCGGGGQVMTGWEGGGGCGGGGGLVFPGWEATAELRRREAAAQPPRPAAVIVGVTGATSDEEVCVCLF